MPLLIAIVQDAKKLTVQNPPSGHQKENKQLMLDGFLAVDRMTRVRRKNVKNG
jgi:hypothetical protein